MSESRVANVVYLDSETKNLFDDVGGRGRDIAHWLSDEFILTQEGVCKLAFGIASTYDNRGMKFWHDPSELLEFLMSEEVDVIITFNGEAFDFPMIISQLAPPEEKDGKLILPEPFQEIYSRIGEKSLDLMVKIEEVLGHRISLDSIKTAMFNETKTASGADFWKMFTSDDITKRIAAINYLMADVLDMYRIFGVAHELGQLAYLNQASQVTIFDIKLPDVREIVNGNTPF